MSQEINLQSILGPVKKASSGLVKHVTFAAIILVLLAYLFMVWRISQLAAAEPSPEDEGAAVAASHISKIDKDAIKQIEELEKSNTEIKSLFNAARNNPFSE